MLNATLLILFVFILIIGMEAYLYVKKFNFYLTLLIPILFVFSPEIIGIVPSAFYFVTFILVALACIGRETRQQSKKIKSICMESQRNPVANWFSRLGIVSCAVSKGRIRRSYQGQNTEADGTGVGRCEI